MCVHKEPVEKDLEPDVKEGELQVKASRLGSAAKSHVNLGNEPFP